MVMCGGSGRTGYLVRKMQLNKLYTIEAVEALFSENIKDPDNHWGLLERKETKQIFTNIRRAECYHTAQHENPRRIELLKVFTEVQRPSEPDVFDDSAAVKKFLYAPLVGGNKEVKEELFSVLCNAILSCEVSGDSFGAVRVQRLLKIGRKKSDSLLKLWLRFGLINSNKQGLYSINKQSNMLVTH